MIGFSPGSKTQPKSKIGKRARKAHDELARVSQTLDEETYPDNPASSKGSIEKPQLYDTGPVPPPPALMELLALVLELAMNSRPGAPNCTISPFRFQAGSYVAYYGDKTPKEAHDAQRLRMRRLRGLTTQVGGARLIIERCTKLTSSGDSDSPVTDFEVDQDAETFGNCH